MWVIVATKATIESWPEYRANKRAYDAVRKAPETSTKIIRCGRFKRSRAMLAAFSLTAVIGWEALIFSILAPPPRVDVSLNSALVTTLLVIALYLFERAKKADVDMRSEAAIYHREHENQEHKEENTDGE